MKAQKNISEGRRRTLHLIMDLLPFVLASTIWLIIPSPYSLIPMIWKWILNASKSENETTITFGGRNGVGGGGGCIMETDRT